jgi:uncharacterized protein YkwD
MVLVRMSAIALAVWCLMSSGLAFAANVRYHEASPTLTLTPDERRLAEHVRHEFGLTGKSLPQIDASMVTAARYQARQVLDVGDGGLSRFGHSDLREVLREFGVSDYRVRGGLMSGSDFEGIRPQLEDWCKKATDGGWNRLGVGVAERDGRVAVVVFLTERMLQLSPVARHLGRPGVVKLEGQTPIGVRSLSLHVTDPNGGMQTIRPTRIASGAFSQALSLARPGGHRVEIMIDSGRGPQVAALLLICVTTCSQRKTTPELAAPQSHDIETARLYVLRWTNAFRKQNGLSMLSEDSGLQRVIQDYVDAIGYDAPLLHEDHEGEGPGERIKAAGIRVLAYGENLGRHSRLDLLMEKLAESPAHRQNMLSPQFAQVGLAVCYHPERDAWTVGQLFATLKGGREWPVEAILGPPEGLAAAISAERARQGMPDLVLASPLNGAALSVLRAESKSGHINPERAKQQIQSQLAHNPNNPVQLVVVLTLSRIEELFGFSGFFQKRWTIGGVGLVRLRSGGYLALILLGQGEIENIPKR